VFAFFFFDSDILMRIETLHEERMSIPRSTHLQIQKAVLNAATPDI
jgi:hypothetical protein